MEKRFSLIEAPSKEFENSNTLSTNVLTIYPGECIMLDGFPKTRDTLSKFGIKTKVFNGNALCVGCEGGPTCLTRPIYRNKLSY